MTAWDVSFVVVDTLALALLALIAASFALSARRTAIGWLVALLVFNYACYVLSARQDYAFHIPEALQIHFGGFYVVLNLARNSISWVLMVLAHRLFLDDRRLPPILIALIALQLFLEEPLGWMLGAEWAAANPKPEFLLYEFSPAVLQTLFSALALYWAFADRRFDLVESRRTARLVILPLIGVQGLLSLLVERIAFMGALVPYQLTYPIHMLLVALQVLIFTVVVVWLLRRDVFDFLANERLAVEPSEEAAGTSKDVARLIAALEEDRVYREMGLTVAGLASHVGVPEYRLRRLIHDHLGYRNFSAFLHHYRIEEVCRALEDPRQNRTPILTLALSSGYQSINPFNRAFKDRMQMTPSEYRTSVQQDGVSSPGGGDRSASPL